MKTIHQKIPSSLKLIYLSVVLCSFIFYGFLISGCNPTDNQKMTASETVETAHSATTDNSSIELNQNGEYTDLFNSGLKNCEFLTIAELADAIGAEENKVATKDNGYYCEYTFKDDNGLITRFQITSNPMKKTDIKKEINGYLKDEEALGKDSRLVEVRQSETGDTYLMMNQDRHVNMFNTNYENFINVAYTPVFDSREQDVEFINTKKTEMRNRAFAIANALLKKYKK